MHIPEEFANVSQFPDHGVTVDGYIVCIDSTAPFDSTSMQRIFFTNLISSVQSTRKPVVIACTKCDSSEHKNLMLIREVVDKLKKVPPIIEVSAHDSVNIDLCFLMLAHLVDTRKPKSRIIPYIEAKQVVDARVKKNMSEFQKFLNLKLADFAMENINAFEVVESSVEWKAMAQLKGTECCKRLVEKKLEELWHAAITKQIKIFQELLPEYLSELLPEISHDETHENCLARLHNHPKFSEYFIEYDSWEEDKEFLSSFSKHVPISLLRDSKEGKVILESYIKQKKQEENKQRAQEKIRRTLESSSDLLPGKL